MGIEAILALFGGVALLIGIFGGGIEAERIKIPQINCLLRVILSLTGTGLLALAVTLAVLSKPELLSPVLPDTPTATPVPTETPLPAPSSTPVPSDTPAPTAAPSVTPLPTLPVVILSDSFDSNANNWYTGSWEDSYVIGKEDITGGKYRWEMTAKKNGLWKSQPDMPGLADFSASVDGRCIEGPDDGVYGFAFREREDNKYYFLVADEAQQYQFLLVKDGDWKTLIGWTLSYAIRPGEVNRITVVAQGVQFTFYINGTYVDQASDTALASGESGLAAGLYNAGDTAVFEFDNFELRSPGQ
jgi:hypothetical protein